MILVSDSATPLPIVNQSRLFEGSGRTSLFYPIFSLLSTPSLFLRPFHAFFGYASPFSFSFFLLFCNFLPLFSCASLRLFKPIFCFLFLCALFISFLRLFCAFPAPFSACFRAFFSCFFPFPSALALRLSCASLLLFLLLRFFLYILCIFSYVILCLFESFLCAFFCIFLFFTYSYLSIFSTPLSTSLHLRSRVSLLFHPTFPFLFPLCAFLFHKMISHVSGHVNACPAQITIDHFISSRSGPVPNEMFTQP